MSQPPQKRSPLFVIKAALSTIAVTVGLLYVIGLLAGKNGPGAPPPATPAQETAADAALCPASTKMASAARDLAKGEVAAMAIGSGGEKLADFAFKGPDGQEKTLASFAGKTLLLNLWATWCVPCRAEMPALDHLQSEKGSDKFEVAAVNVDVSKPEKTKAFLDEAKVQSLASYSGADLFFQLKQAGKALGLPTTLLIGPDGCQIGLLNGPAAWDSADAKALIDAALSSAP